MAPPHCSKGTTPSLTRATARLDKRRRTTHRDDQKIRRQKHARACYRESSSYERFVHRMLLQVDSHCRESSELPTEESLASSDLYGVYEDTLEESGELFGLDERFTSINVGVEHTKTLEGEHVQSYTIHDTKARTICIQSNTLGFLEPIIVTRSKILAQRATTIASDDPSLLNSFIIDSSRTNKYLGRSLTLPLYLFTGWGEKYRLVLSVNDLKRSIHNLPDAHTLQAIAADETFWDDLGLLSAALEPIEKAIRRVELNERGLRHTISEWEAIYNALTSLSKARAEDVDLVDLPDIVKRVCRDRFRVSPATIAAYMLDPANITTVVPLMAGDTPLRSLVLISEQTSQNANVVLKEFESLRSCRYSNTKTKPIWDHEGDPLSFYNNISGAYPALAKVAKRLFATPCTSMPAERSISMTNSLVNAARNGLDFHKRDVQQSVFNNDRMLRGAKLWGRANDDVEVNKEQRLLEDDVITAVCYLKNTSGR
ncbi:hypothetical protein M409DRAFT_61216 [Zasmidium cellare ATCC 36951]|uniref:HAT C-terminal dimerisation domain-containing protein n=1 Tax=Zasmidium cellare ATCC 36951 TaxID=1080233 RepID=A0A6A6BZS3_ZASCE|nr:uncharacterized protein M409DRAFT_61216 [Zasmidium cellare ATCC 36951]KAF2158946.1 hypothetical protein M409DRAFT_61216 [Zasmidium cellare ATCC 36951]